MEELTEALDEREKMKQVVREREEKLESLNKSFDEKDKLLQELESRSVLLRLYLDCTCIAFRLCPALHLDCIQISFK